MANSELDATFAEYQSAVTHDIESCLSEMGCQPILFVGSGLSKRYFGAPNWDELLMLLAVRCPLIEKEYAYYKQTLNGDYPLIGKEFARMYQEWAWGAGKGNFPADMFTADVPAQSYIKYVISQILSDATPKTIMDIKDPKLQAEIKALQNIRPHALITTNFDQFLENVFPEYQPVIGQSIIQGTQILTGEIFKIHGCVSSFSSLVFTQEDYEQFGRKKKYLSAKLLTYFSEHPLVFIGYSASDPNIQAILSDIDECLSGSHGSVIPNIYILEWRRDFPVGYLPAKEKLIPIAGNRSIRIKAIEASDFSWVFEAFGANQPLNAVSPKILRALLSRSYDLVRYDIPRQTVHADFEMLEGAVSSEQSFAKLFGITTVSAGSTNNAQYPYTMTDLAIRLTNDDKAYWAVAKPFVTRVSSELGVSISASDNRYHTKTKTGRKSYVHKYSHELLEIISAMRTGKAYKLELM